MDLSLSYPEAFDVDMAKKFCNTIHRNTFGKIAIGYKNPKEAEYWKRYLIAEENINLHRLRRNYNCYLSVNDFFSTSQTSTEKDVCMVNGIYLDTDIHKVAQQEEIDSLLQQSLSILEEKIAAGLFPPVQMVTLTGRGSGIFLLYQTPIDAVDTEQIELHQAVYRAAVRKLDSFWKEAGIYPKVSEDASVMGRHHLCRIPGTKNLEADRYASLVYLEEETAFPELSEIASFFTKEELYAKEDTPTKKGNFKGICHFEETCDILTNRQTVTYVRFVTDCMEKLAQLRGGFKGSMRQNLLFVYYNLKKALEGEEEARRAVFEMNDSFFDPLPDSEIYRCVFGSTDRHYEKGAYTGAGRLHGDGIYVFGKDTLVDILKITEEEKKEIALYKWAEIKDRADENRLLKKERRELAIRLKLEGCSIAEIMERTGVTSTSTVYGWFHKAGLQIGGEKKAFLETQVFDFGLNNKKKQTKQVPEEKTDTVRKNTPANEKTVIPFSQKEESISALEEWNHAMEVLHDGKNVILHGKAGTGKTFLIEQFIREMEAKGKNVLKTAFTGLAAAGIGGNTAHATFTLPLQILAPNTQVPTDTVFLLKEVDILVIDEVGTLRFDYFSKIAQAVMLVKQIYGHQIQVILSGDFLQTNPVVTKNTRKQLESAWETDIGTGHPFKAKQDWEDLCLVPVNLTKVYRQTEPDFMAALEKARIGDVSCVSFFQTLKTADKYSDFGIHLCPYRSQVEEINHYFEERYCKEKRAYQYRFGKEKKIFAIGAPVIATRNTKSFKNGEIGEVIRINKKSITVSFAGKKPVRVYPVRDYQSKDFILPIELAHAITVHKAQGKTFDRAVIHTEFFEEGQAYVAFSRVKTKEGIRIAGKVRAESFMRDREVLAELEQVIGSKKVFAI